MTETIPPDEEISKTQLWQRIDYLREVIESYKGETGYQLQTVKESLKTDTSHLNSEHTLLVQKKLEEFKNIMASFQIDANVKIEDAVKTLKRLFNDHVSEIEKKLLEMKEYIEMAVRTESEIHYSKNEQNIIKMQDDFVDLSKNMNEALSKYQVEIRGKIGELRSKIERVIFKLRDGFQDL